MYPKPIEIICYHCEQSAEKYLKGYLIRNENKLERTHDLVMLNNKCKKIDEDFIEVEKEDKTLIKINKNVIISVVQIEKNGRLTYIKYRD